MLRLGLEPMWASVWHRYAAHSRHSKHYMKMVLIYCPLPSLLNAYSWWTVRCNSLIIYYSVHLYTYLFVYRMSIMWDLTFYLLNYSMEQSPSREANRFSASQEIPHILWNQKVNYCSHKWPPSVPILSQLDLVHTPHIPLPEDPS